MESPSEVSLYSRKPSASDPSQQPADVSLEDGVGPAVRLSDIRVCGEATNQAPGGILKDSKQAWLVCAAAFFIQVTIVGVLHVFGVFFVELLKEFDTSRAEAGKFISRPYGYGLYSGVVINS